MDKLILDFEGERIEIASGISPLTVLTQKGMKIKHSGGMWTIVDRYVDGLDERAYELASREDIDSPLESEVSLVIILEKA